MKLGESKSEKVEIKKVNQSQKFDHILNVRYSNGQTQSFSVAKDMPFQEVVELIKKAVSNKPIKITTVFPQKDITKSIKTVGQLDLLNSSIRVKIL